MPRRKSSTTLCRSCLYVTSMWGQKYACGFCLFTGKSRGCEIEDCTKYEKRTKEKRKKLESEIRTIVKREKNEYVSYIGEIISKGKEV